ncbi:MAG: substrate-binding domain-containing protein, partial [Patescibacteria group bacterium]|nr:substrate-binding domain-containing protein [Patescibacteria group bacterium]
MKTLCSLTSLVAIMVAAGAASAQVTVDPAVKPYEKVAGVSGNLNSIGSDTLNNLMTMWLEGFQKTYPNVTYSIKGEGSATAPPALIEGTAQLGPMSREMKDSETDAFEKKYGFQPTMINVAVDCLAVYVHKDNPVKGLTIPQVDCIFSQTQLSGFRSITTWGQVGQTGSWEKLPISLYGRNSVSGTYAFFKENALLKGDFKDTVKEQPGSAAVVNGVAN